MIDIDALAARATDELARLIAFDTTSRRSNLELIGYVENALHGIGVASQRVPNPQGTKANLMATIGPPVAGGVVLSGHTDVVPVDGQSWTSDPFTLARRGDRLYGRGACDMKGFLALALAAAPQFARGSLKRPVHLAFSYDEEVGCLGAPDLIAAIAAEALKPAMIIVGEPTGMEVVSGHKGISAYRVTVWGREAHSSQTHLGVSANMVAVTLMGHLHALATRLVGDADPSSPFLPKEATLTIGQITGGTAINILARKCEFVFDLRTPPGLDPQRLLAGFFAEAAALDATLKRRFPEAGVEFAQLAAAPPFAPEIDGVAEGLARRLTGDNGPVRAVPYAAEAGQFQQAGYSVAICGPGSIDQAHQADEYVEIQQMRQGAAFMVKLADAMS